MRLAVTVATKNRRAELKRTCAALARLDPQPHEFMICDDGRPAAGPLVTKSVVIENRVWIGAHATVLKGVTVGKGAVIGAGSVATHSVPAGITVAGNPARPLRPSA
jgi:acetyltransferase-like isoleucine patch superfamily enzyme